MTLTEKDYKEGLSITCIIDDTKIDDAKLHFEHDYWFICQNLEDGEDCEDKLGYKYSYILPDWSVSNIKLKEKTIYNLEEGDIVVNKDGYERMILGVHKYIYHLSELNNFEIYDYDYTPKELIEYGYKVKQPVEDQPKTTLSMDEIAEKFDIPVSQLEIITEK